MVIKKTFCMLDGISVGKERKLWQQGIDDWNSFLDNDVKGISKKRKMVMDMNIRKIRQRFLDDDMAFFAAHLKQSEHWRLYEHLRSECLFLDIEINSVQERGYITVASFYDGHDIKTVVHGMHDLMHMKDMISGYKMLVTFNGSVFDKPFIDKRYDLFDNMLHFDLRFAMKRLGFSGGLKSIENDIKIKRKNRYVEKICSGDPTRLWKTYLATGDKYYLNLLVEYNQEDTINLMTIADYAYKNLKDLILLPSACT